MAESETSKSIHSFYQSLVLFVVTFFVGLFFNWSINYFFTLSNGTIGIGTKVKIKELNYIPIAIENISSASIDNLKLIVPNSVKPEEIITTNTPIKIIQDENNDPDEKIIVLSNIEPLTRSNIFIPSSTDQITSNEVRPLNNNSLKLKLKPITDLTPNYLTALLYATIPAFAYAISYIIFVAYVEKRNASINEQLSKQEAAVEKQLERIKKQEIEIDEISARLIKANNKTTDIQLRLIKRISDLNKEIDFWRDTIRKLIYQATNTPKGKLDDVFLAISSSLKTRSTHASRQKVENAIENLEEISDIKE